jgi:hypothetical protein
MPKQSNNIIFDMPTFLHQSITNDIWQILIAFSSQYLLNSSLLGADIFNTCSLVFLVCY